MPCVFLHPQQRLFEVVHLGIFAHIAHEDPLEAAEVAVDGLAHGDDLVRIGEPVARALVDLFSVLHIHGVLRVVVERQSCAEHRALIVGRHPMVVVVLHGAVRLPCAAVGHLAVGGVIEQLALAGIDGDSLSEPRLVAGEASEVAGGNRGRAVDARVGAQLVFLALLPYEGTEALMGAVVHALIVVAGIVKILRVAEILICAGTGEHHPCDIVVVLVVAPVRAVAVDEVDVKLAENIFIFGIAGSGERIKDGLEHLGVAPPAAATEHMAFGGNIVILLDEAVHDGVAHIGVVSFGSLCAFIYGEDALGRVGRGLLHQSEACALLVRLHSEAVFGTTGRNQHPPAFRSLERPAREDTAVESLIGSGTGLSAGHTQIIAAVEVAKQVGVVVGALLEHPSLSGHLGVGPHYGFCSGLQAGISHKHSL